VPSWKSCWSRGQPSFPRKLPHSHQRRRRW
jgi:hypothetical protein